MKDAEVGRRFLFAVRQRWSWRRRSELLTREGSLQQGKDKVPGRSSITRNSNLEPGTWNFVVGAACLAPQGSVVARSLTAPASFSTFGASQDPRVSACSSLAIRVS